MKNWIISSLLLLLFAPGSVAQFAALHIKVKVPDTRGRMVYIAGSFNGWATNDSLYQLHPVAADVWEISIPVFRGKRYEYKYVLGQWQHVELSGSTAGIANRYLVASKKNNHIIDTVRQWQWPLSSTDSTDRQKQFAAMKDSLMAKMQPVIGDLMVQLQGGITNMLEDNPSAERRQQLQEKLQADVGLIFKELDALLWKLAGSLSPEQKAKVKKALSDPAKKDDVFNTFLNAVQGVQ